MPASMMIEPVVEILNVIGSRMAIAPAGPMPGSTPTSVPTRVPTKQRNRFSGVKAIEKPYNRLCRVSIGLLSPYRHSGYQASIPLGNWTCSPKWKRT